MPAGRHRPAARRDPRKVIAYAEAQLGKAYQYGAAPPDTFDCSGLAMMAYRAAGLYVPRTSQEQWQFGTWIPPSAAQPGDLVFFAGSDGHRRRRDMSVS